GDGGGRRNSLRMCSDDDLGPPCRTILHDANAPTDQCAARETVKYETRRPSITNTLFTSWLTGSGLALMRIAHAYVRSLQSK
ncbi:MAG: hypothetical protein JWN96_77, partial [Mycobacterium sp.]|nr:hypothetical protein [Mycobacterium sp.]